MHTIMEIDRTRKSRAAGNAIAVVIFTPQDG